MKKIIAFVLMLRFDQEITGYLNFMVASIFNHYEVKL